MEGDNLRGGFGSEARHGRARDQIRQPVRGWKGLGFGGDGERVDQALQMCDLLAGGNINNGDGGQVLLEAIELGVDGAGISGESDRQSWEITCGDGPTLE